MINSSRIVSIPGGMLTWLMSRAAAGGGVTDMQLDIQTFTSNGTWTKPADALSCEILIVNGGDGGGGGGYADDAGVSGSGGNSGTASIHQIPACMIPATVAVVIGAGGAGGAGAVGVPSPGDSGEYSSFGPLTESYEWNFDFPDSFSSAGGWVNKIVAGNGGAGGAIDGAGVDGLGTLSPTWDGMETTYRWSNNGTGGAAHANGTAGGACPAGGAGGGGGGGAVTATSAGGNGGAGGAYGGGGGGGGSGDGTFTGGDGGAGADGVVIVYTITA